MTVIQENRSYVSKSWWFSVKDPYFLSFSYGFGLPACKAYVEKLGGTLHIESMQVSDKKLKSHFVGFISETYKSLARQWIMEYVYCEILTLQGIGTDSYIRLRHIDGKYESFRI